MTGKLYGLDVETSCNVPDCTDKHCRHALDHNRARITCIAVTDGLFEEHVFRHLSAMQEWREKNPDAVFTMHNGKFDMKMLRANGVNIPLDRWAHDSSLLAFNYHEQIPASWLEEYDRQRVAHNKERTGLQHRKAGGLSLKTLAPYWLQVKPFWEPETGHDNDEYVLKDARYALQLTEFFLQHLKPRSFTFYNTKHLPWTKGLLQTEEFGIRLDEGVLNKKWEESASHEINLRLEIEEQWREHFLSYHSLQAKHLLIEHENKLAKMKAEGRNTEGRIRQANRHLERKLQNIEPLNLDSPVQLKWLLQECLGLDTTNLDGEESTDKETLTRLSEENTQVAKLLQYRKVKKLNTTYYPEYLNYVYKGRIHTTFNTIGTRTGRLSASDPNCLSKDMRLLTKTGFKYHTELMPNEEIAQFHKELGIISFTKNWKLIHNDKKQQELLIFRNQHINLEITPDHRILTYNRKSRKWSEGVAQNFPKDALIWHGGYTSETGTEDIDILKLTAAIQADAEITERGQARLRFKKLRKIARLTTILHKLNISFEYSIKKDIHEFKFFIPNKVNQYLTTEKYFTKNLLHLNSVQLKEFLEELPHWDGLYTRQQNIEYVSKYKQNTEVLAACASLVGWRAKISEYKWIGKNYWRLYITKRCYSSTANLQITKKYTDFTWCVSVPSSYIIVENNGTPCVIGNCQQVPSALHELFTADPGHILITRDLSAIEPVVLAYFSEDPILCDLMITGGDFHSTNAKAIFDLEVDLKSIKEHYIKERKVAKECGLAVLYGAGAGRIYQVLQKHGLHDLTFDDAKRFVYRLRDLYAGVWRFKQELDREFEAGATLYNLLGRPLTIPIASDCYMLALNTLIQSSASDLLQEAAARIRTKYEVLLLVHDEIVVQVPESKVSEAIPFIEDSMKKIVDLKTKYGSIPIKVEGKESLTWEK